MHVYTVRQLTGRIKELLESDLQFVNLLVKGEISNLKQAASGHVYFTLKDNYSCIRVVMFRSGVKRLKFVPENGMAVRVRGYVTVYERGGQYQLYAEEVEPDGTGALFAALEKLKQQLAAEGLFDPSYKKQLPRFPQCVGIVTSPTGAVVRDMINILRRRWPLVKILLSPVSVQGETAAEEVAQALMQLNKLNYVDLIIVGRGGGSLEELWAFNTEVVARSIAASNIPVISAVGHETDFTIADLVADLRAPTPSAAAELAVPDRLEIKRVIDIDRVRLTRSMKQQLNGYRQRLEHCVQSGVMVKPVASLCDQRRQTVDLLEKQLLRGARGKVSNINGQLSLLAGRLNALSPLSTLARGYSFTTSADGVLLREADKVNVGDPITVHLYQGKLKCTVRDIKIDK